MLIGATLLAYPFVVYFGIQSLGARWLMLLLLVLACMRVLTLPVHRRRQAVGSLLVVAALLGLLAYWVSELVALRFYPVAVGMLASFVFAVSLCTEQPLVERFARLQSNELRPVEIRYTRRLTAIWSIVLLCNASVALWTALYASMEIWTLYNGAISYLLLGVFFVLEWMFRRHRLARAAGSW